MWNDTNLLSANYSSEFTWWCEEKREPYNSHCAAQESGPTPLEKQVKSITATPVCSVVFVLEQNLW
jgi:hypothetical protein